MQQIGLSNCFKIVYITNQSHPIPIKETICVSDGIREFFGISIITYILFNICIDYVRSSVCITSILYLFCYHTVNKT